MALYTAAWLNFSEFLFLLNICFNSPLWFKSRGLFYSRWAFARDKSTEHSSGETELAELFDWQSYVTALNEQHPGLLWKVSLSARADVSVLCMRCDVSLQCLRRAPPPWTMQVLSILMYFCYFFLPVTPCCHSLFQDVSEFPLDSNCVFGEFYQTKSGWNRNWPLGKIKSVAIFTVCGWYITCVPSECSARSSGVWVRFLKRILQLCEEARAETICSLPALCCGAILG